MIAPSIGRPVRCSADVRAVWVAHNGDRPVPANRPRPWRPKPTAEEIRLAEFADACQRLDGLACLPLDEQESTWRAVTDELFPTGGQTAA
ncbi:hypothetical protein ACTD5D_33215 [Nocardia takedensis]|uniref:hypothetical protein n=1 Tax=Nocardia takedensis TaxID=259390 RepID=UPI003F75B587